jgi:hypothetical protein
MLLLCIFIIIILLIVFIIWQIKRAIRMRKNAESPLTLSTGGKLNNGVLSGLFFQLLESLDIMNTSKNVDIIIGRYEFVNKLTTGLAPHSLSPTYNKSFVAVVENYKQMYYDKTLFEDQVTIAKNPQDKSKLVNFYASSLIRALYMNVQNHNEAIISMKQKKAIQGRYDKIIELCDMVKEQILSLNIENRNNYLDQVFNLKRETSIKKETI